ncbi:hypothetical protein V6Z12_D08G161700 [Gossypium hirsutum]
MNFLQEILAELNRRIDHNSHYPASILVKLF